MCSDIKFAPMCTRQRRQAACEMNFAVPRRRDMAIKTDSKIINNINFCY